MKTKNILNKRTKYMFPLVEPYFKEPLYLIKARGQFVYDNNNKKYLDAYSGVATVNFGHSCPEIIKAVIEQIKMIQHTSLLFLTDPVVKLAEQLAKDTPEGLSKSFFLNSGSEAVEMAILLAKMYTHKSEIIAFQYGYHGCSSAANSVTGIKGWKNQATNMPGVIFVPAPYCYRCPLGLSFPQCNLKCAQKVEEAINNQSNNNVAALIAEPILGVGGIIVPPEGYFKKVKKIIKRHKIVFIADEIQTGMGRTGQSWGMENFNTIPDIMILGKGLGNGIPISAIVASSKIANKFKGKLFFSTFGGNPISCIAALKALKILKNERYKQKVQQLGKWLKQELIKKSKNCHYVGEVRGKGLMIGIEIVQDKKNKKPNKELTILIQEECKKRGVILGRGGVYQNVIRIAPPLCINKSDAEKIVKVLLSSFKVYEK